MSLKESAKGIIIPIKVVPKANRNELIAKEEDEWRIRVAAVPEKGKANTELLRYLSKVLNTSRSNLDLISGEGSRHKRVLCKGLDAEYIEKRLEQACLRRK